MILKIKGYGFDGETQGKTWWIYGDLKRIRYEEVSYLEHIDNDYDLLNLSNKIEASPDRDRRVISIAMLHLNGQEYTILTDTIAYICNESGETVEKIVCNC